MSMKGIFWAVLAPSQAEYDKWCATSALYVEKPDGWTLQRCKRIENMLHVYQAQKSGVEVIRLESWENAWNPGEIREIYRRLEL